MSAALHAAAHLIYSSPQDSNGLNNRQLVLISLLEDARVEALCYQHFPGIQSLFRKRFQKEPSNTLLFEEIAYAVAYALVNGEKTSENPFVTKAVHLFDQAFAEDPHDPSLFRAVGLALANDIGQMRISMNERDEFSLVDYRDDNSYLWNTFEEVATETGQANEVEEPVSVTGVGYEEVQDGKAVSSYKEGELEVDGLVFSAVEEEVQSTLLNHAPTHQMYLYPEWDYKIARCKQQWCSLDEIRLHEQNSDELSQRINRYKSFVKKLQHIIQSYQSQMHRRKKQEDGIELDFEAIIDYLVELKKGGAGSESRIYIDHVRERQHELSLLVLLDLSESMNDPHAAGEESVLDLTLDSTVVLSELLDSLGHSYAIQGFNSNGRGEVSYFNFKDFDDESDAALATLGLAEAAYSTRLGAALRHAFYKIAKRPERHKLILVITDGQPSDIDVYDPQYLIEDSAVAVREIEASGCKTFCLSLDKNADRYVQKIFRRGQFEVVEHAEKLPQILTKLYLKVFKSFLA
ncbi:MULTISPECIES: nitric oxide reductase activation protein NorD [Thiomicrorhabdus]|uniref:VWA domain-containing protein n=1 Tax=Thiomicrorhabdus heinhorstiae TaxID=2748010 RepID=A0ABS0BZW8_9GAMM|nr:MULTISPECIES: VWA domain-containing protein [Thiomicrorhabdus]MBF6058628.1 VWA domain-containing protein [Thiomicrorhabdus heinhorstiae]